MRRLLLLVPSRPDPLFRGGIKGGEIFIRAGLPHIHLLAPACPVIPDRAGVCAEHGGLTVRSP